MTRPVPEVIHEELRGLIAILTLRTYSELSDSDRFREDLGIDGTLAVEIVLAVARRFRIDIPEDTFRRPTTIGESLDLLEQWMTEPYSFAACA